MQLRFVAVAGPREALGRHRRRLGGKPDAPVEVLSRPGLSVWAGTDVPTVAAAQGDAIAIGVLFDRSSGARLRQLTSPVPTPDKFTRTLWGAYVLISDEGDRHRVLRDPSGGVTVYHRRSGAADIYASDLDMLAAADAQPMVPDMAFVRSWLSYPRLRRRQTGIEGVTEILPGEAYVAGGDGVAHALAWNPLDHVWPERERDDFGEAAGRLHDALVFALPRIAACAEDVVLQLSGGLDSSAIAGTLASAGCRFRAMTFITQAPDGDERVYAREVAGHCGAPLAELAEQPGAPAIEDIPPRSLRPPPVALLRPLHRAFADHLANTGAQLALDGSGGDNVFCFPASAAPALDALRARGPGAALGTLTDLARVFETTAWAAARSAWRGGRRGRAVWHSDTSFLTPGLEVSVPSHPWLDAIPERLPRGKFEHIQSIVGIWHFLGDPIPDAPASLHPLLSQPVLETCLGIPSWVWIRGGRDRAVARAACTDFLPRGILARRSKGRLESMFVSGYMSSRAELQVLLEDGLLARAGLLDTAAITAYLRRSEQPRDAGYIRLLELASAETWLRSFDA